MNGDASPPPADDGEPNPGRMRSGCVPPPLVLVVFGASGDLTRRKLMPALWRLHEQGLLPEGFSVVGAALEPLTDAEFRQRMRDALAEFASPPEEEAWAHFSRHMAYVSLPSDSPEGMVRLARRVKEVDAACGAHGNRLFYLAIPPGAVGQTVEGLGRAGLVHDPADAAWSRVVVEKPFGRDLASARALNATLLRVFDESQLFRIDHYLGKETVQNLLVFRFANVVWEPVWNRNFVDHVQITVAEAVGVEGRAGYYDRAGALRDMVQSHLLQLLTLVAMEPPAAYDADSIRSEKVKVLHAVRPVAGAEVARETVRGRYAASADGTMPGYRDEPGVDDGSRTETYAALRLHLDSWRWAGVPFYLRTGKRLAERASEVVIRFRPAPHPILDVVQNDRPAPNALVLRIQPREGISLFFEAKVPGLAGPLQPVSMDFDYTRTFGVESPDAYERLLLDAMLGDATLFARRDEVEAAWGLVTPILEAWAEGGEPEPYPSGSWGPAGADRLLAEEGRAWRTP